MKNWLIISDCGELSLLADSPSQAVARALRILYPRLAEAVVFADRRTGAADGPGEFVVFASLDGLGVRYSVVGSGFLVQEADRGIAP